MTAFSSFDDRALIILLKQRDEAAFTEIYNRYWNKLTAIAYNHTKDKSAAEEIVQEVFISLWKHKNSFEIESLGHYLGTAIKFTIFKSFYRQREKQNELLKKITTNAFQSDEEKINAMFLHEYIKGFVEQLPEKCKIVFKCSRESEFNIPESAIEMNIAEKTVEAHLTKALKFLRLNLTHS